MISVRTKICTENCKKAVKSSVSDFAAYVSEILGHFHLCLTQETEWLAEQNYMISASIWLLLFLFGPFIFFQFPSQPGIYPAGCEGQNILPC